MFELVLRISTETSLGELRAFVAMADGMATAMPIAHYDIQDELDGISVAITAQQDQ